MRHIFVLVSLSRTHFFSSVQTDQSFGCDMQGLCDLIHGNSILARFEAHPRQLSFNLSLWGIKWLAPHHKLRNNQVVGLATYVMS